MSKKTTAKYDAIAPWYNPAIFQGRFSPAGINQLDPELEYSIDYSTGMLKYDPVKQAKRIMDKIKKDILNEKKKEKK